MDIKGYKSRYIKRNSPEIEIIIGVNKVIKASIIDSEEFTKLKNELVEVQWKQTKKRGISRIWKDEIGNYFIEFYNQVAFKFNSKEEFEKTENVEFLRVPLFLFLICEHCC